MRKSKTESALLVGTWRSADEFGSAVEYRVSKKKNGDVVVARDTSDGEVADIFEEKWDAVAGILSFATHWNSTGRFARCRLRATSKKQAEFTYTYTDVEVLIRSDEKTA